MLWADLFGEGETEGFIRRLVPMDNYTQVFVSVHSFIKHLTRTCCLVLRVQTVDQLFGRHLELVRNAASRAPSYTY